PFSPMYFAQPLAQPEFPRPFRQKQTPSSKSYRALVIFFLVITVSLDSSFQLLTEIFIQTGHFKQAPRVFPVQLGLG
ncbi:hypothetical protein N9F36_06595, partial [Akkermansiaceae bacterium]|nr:hypothetical protein [Akkermansiaceae bacterium]